MERGGGPVGRSAGILPAEFGTADNRAENRRLEVGATTTTSAGIAAESGATNPMDGAVALLRTISEDEEEMILEDLEHRYEELHKRMELVRSFL